MATVIPFRGYRFDPEKVGPIRDVVTPPYDRVSSDVQDACYARSPHNIVRIIKGKAEPGDDGTVNVYTRAAGFLRSWIDEGILVRDPVPALYAYHQAYAFAGRRLIRKGFVALGKLEPEKVHAHEQTLKGPKVDRLKLMRATEANFGHIFMLYRDPERVADRLLAAEIDGAEPEIEATDADGNAHRLWRVDDPGTIAGVQEALADRDLYIADGHHRYETAVTYMGECVANGWRPAAPESFDVRMMALFNVAEPGTSIRPIHRLIHGVAGFDAEAFLAAAAEPFVVERHPSFDAMVSATRAGRDRHTFGCCTAGNYATLRLRDEASIRSLVPRERSDDYARLDVTILHAAILERLLGIDARALEEQRNVTYTVDARAGADAVASGGEQILFVLNPTSADEVIRVADRGERMPQKSTDFYPKLLTGLVLSVMEIEK
jgi:uncharacterized protein (DUF1015 family)